MAELGPAVLELEAPPLTSAGLGTRTGEHEVRVWVTDVGGPRLFEVPSEAILDVKWSKGLDKTSSASVVIDRYWLLDQEDPESWLQNRIERVTTEVQVSWDGLFRVWGPVLDKVRTPGESCEVKASGWPYWYGCRLIGGKEPIWSREWLQNPLFASGTASWSTDGSPTVDTVTFETAGQSLELATGESVTQRVWMGLGPQWTMRAAARVRAPLGSRVLVELWTEQGVQPGVHRRVEYVGTGGGWFTVLAQATARHQGVAPIPAFVRVSVTDGDPVNLDRVSLQVSPESLGLPPGQPAPPRFLTQRVAFQSLVNTVGGDFKISPAAMIDGRVINAPWAARQDVFVSEGLRQLSTADDGIERSELNTETDRIDVMSDLIGVTHDPEAVTLTARINGGPGNCSIVGPISDATGRPVSELTVMGEDEFWGSHRDETAYGGLLLQDLEQAPTGTANTELQQRAKHRLEAGRSDDLPTVLTVVVEDRDVASLLDVGDRVHLVLDDGPDQIDGLVRIQGGDWAPLSEQPAKLTVVPWDGP